MVQSFKLVWKLNEAAKTALGSGSAYSAEFHEAGFRWIAGATSHLHGKLKIVKFSIHCYVSHNAPWICAGYACADPIFHVFGASHERQHTYHYYFNENKSDLEMYRPSFYLTEWMENETPTVHFLIHISISETYVPLTDFTTPNNMSNVILKIGDKKLHVSKEYLAVHSPVFEKMFFGEFDEKGKDEVEIKEVEYEQFVDLLCVIYPGGMELTHRSIDHILELADLYQMDGALKQAEDYILRAKSFHGNKLLIAVKYRLTELRDHCLLPFTSSEEMLKEFASSSMSSNFSASLKAELFDRLLHFTKS